ncbi:MAG TPA: transposase [Terriglobia bacterium]|nr:transposase [Terriglobia bacterium]
MPRQRHFYGLNHLHYLTRSTYGRARRFDSERFKRRWVRTLDEWRSELGFKIVGYVLMPEHFHLLIWPSVEPNPSQIVQKLEDRTALFILKNLKENAAYPGCGKMLGRVRLPPTVHPHAPFRVGQRGGCDLNIGSPKKRLEKLNYMHNNPVARKLVEKPGDWAWSSWRFYFLDDASVLSRDRRL